MKQIICVYIVNMNTITIFLIIVGILIALNILQVLRFSNYSYPVSSKNKKIEKYTCNDKPLEVLYEKNKEHANYQELASYVQKTNHGDFMYKDFTMAMPPDFNK
jgi:uncharacterized membrane protein